MTMTPANPKAVRKHWRRENHDPYAEGYDAFGAGQSCDLCPYAEDSADWVQWLEGWENAESETLRPGI